MLARGPFPVDPRLLLVTINRTEVTVDWDPATDAVSAVILEAVADAKDVDPLEIDVPLYDVVDPDALDRLFERTDRASNRRTGRLTFRYEGCEVTVDAAGTITARPDAADMDRPRGAAPAIGAGLGPE